MTKDLLSDSTIRVQLSLIKKTKQRDKSFPWQFEGLKVETDEEGIHVTLPEPSYLGGTMIANVGDSYDEYGDDCLLVQNAVKLYEPLLKEVQRLRTLNQTMSNTLSKF